MKSKLRWILIVGLLVGALAALGQITDTTTPTHSVECTDCGSH